MGENIEIGNTKFLTLCEKIPHKYRRHATLVLALSSLLYGLRPVFPQFIVAWGSLSLLK